MLCMKLTERCFGLISIAFLARLLSPEDFGLVAVASAAYGILTASLSFQFDNALIQKSKIKNDHLNTAWTLNILRGVILTLFLLGLAFAAPYLFEDPRMQPILYVLAILPFAESFTNIGIVYFSKNIEFNKLFNFQITVKFITFIITISAAFYYQSYWALIVGMLSSSILNVILSYFFHPYRPRFCLRQWHELFEFSIWLMATNFITQISMKLDVFVVNKWLGSSVVGFYHVGQEIGTMVYSQVIGPLSKTLFPGFSAIKDEKERHRQLYLKSREALIALGLPFGFGFAVVSETFTATVLGPGWELAAIILAAVAIANILHIFTVGIDGALLSVAKTKTLFYRQLIASIIRPVFLITGLFYWGIYGLLVGRFLAAIVMVSVNLHLSAQFFSLSIFSHFRLVWRSILSTALMVAAILVWKNYFVTSFSIDLDILKLIIEVSLGALIYCSSHFLFWVMSGKPDTVERLSLDIMLKTKDKIQNKILSNNV